MLKGRNQKEIYGERYDEIINKRSKSLKKVKHTWHDKIAKSRRKNGTYDVSDDTRKKLAEVSHFNKSGKDHVRIRKILEENNITYDDYLSKLDDYSRYKREVMLLTRKCDVSNLPNSDKRGKAGVNNAYHLDHIVEISEGYVNRISPEKIADISNLQFIPWEENMKKRVYPNGIHNPNVKKYYE